MTSGVRQIAAFNWPFYAGAALAICGASAAILSPQSGPGLRAACGIGLALALVWTTGSLAASWLVYDRSPLLRWDWIEPALGFRPRTWINIHAGFDQSTARLRRLLPDTAGRAFDIFDPVAMREPSIARARRGGHAEGPAEAADFRRLPAADGAADAALLLFSAHELRAPAARHALFRELRRVLGPGGRVIVAEHLRDTANVLAYGPGALHFHSRRTWRRCFAASGFVVDKEFPMTPFVHVFVLRRGA